jgi:hypothetical protein
VTDIPTKWKGKIIQGPSKNSKIKKENDNNKKIVKTKEIESNRLSSRSLCE